MPGFLLPRFTLAEARNTIMKNCSEINFEEIQQGRDTEMTRLLVVFLYGKKFSEPIKTKNWSRPSSSTKVRMGVQKTYDRFLVFGVPGDSEVVCMFTATPVKTRIATRYYQQITPGSPLWLINVDVKGRLYEENNFLLSTDEPFIADNTHGLTYGVKPPYDLDNTTDMKWFAFKTKSLALKRVAVQPRVCPVTSVMVSPQVPMKTKDVFAWRNTAIQETDCQGECNARSSRTSIVRTAKFHSSAGQCYPYS